MLSGEIMRLKLFVASLLATALPLNAALAQAVMQVPVGGATPAPVPVSPPADPDDSPEDIAKDAARDLKDNRFYNKPGATRAQYEADWQECRLIARGSRTPSGSIPYYYNPALMSPLAAGVGGAIGGAIASAIAEGQQRRANRRACLLIRGWRMVEVPSAEAARVGAMGDGARDAYLASIIGAEHVDGKITEVTSFSLQPDPALKLDGPLSGPGVVYLGKKIDPATPIKLAPGEAAIVVAFRRPDEGSAGRSGGVTLSRYDPAARDLVYQRRDWKKNGDTTTYSLNVASGDRKAPHEVQVVRLTPGDYVISGGSIGAGVTFGTYCFGAPTFHVGAGDILYIGDFIPYWAARIANGTRLYALGYTPHIEDARQVLSAAHSDIAAAMKPATLHNRATYACGGISMGRWDLPGIDDLPDPPALAKPTPTG